MAHVAVQALEATQQQVAELQGLLKDVQLKFDCADQHRKSAQKQLEAQDEDFEKLGRRLKVQPPAHLFLHPLCPVDA